MFKGKSLIFYWQLKNEKSQPREREKERWKKIDDLKISPQTFTLTKLKEMLPKRL